MRGGTANCTVIISDELIASPIVKTPDILVVMNNQSLRKFQPALKQRGILLFDSSLIKKPELRSDVEVIEIPATDISGTIGNTKSANMVLLGALIARTKLLKEHSTSEAIEDSMHLKKELIALNKMAFREGIHFYEDKES